jgi:hypothetical protein
VTGLLIGNHRITKYKEIQISIYLPFKILKESAKKKFVGALPLRSIDGRTMSASSITSSATPKFDTVLHTGTISALIGSPPATAKDYYIAKFILLAFGQNTDPLLGASIPPQRRPSDYVFETREPRIIASMSIAIALMALAIGLRFTIRLLRRGLVIGWDDVFIVPGAVSPSV